MNQLSLADRINKLWRLLMTAFCFACFGIGGLILGLVWLNLLRLVYRDAEVRQNKARRSISFSFRLFLNTAKCLRVLDYQIRGIEILRADRGVLIVANHPSLIDYVLIASVLPDVDCLVKADLVNNPFVGFVIKAANYLINSQAETLLQESNQRLQQGQNILIFPEGTRTKPGQPLVLQRGASNIAVRCGCDMRVVHITCTESTLTKGEKWYAIPARKPVFTVTAASLLVTRDFIQPYQETQSLAVRKLTDHLSNLLVPNQNSK